MEWPGENLVFFMGGGAASFPKWVPQKQMPFCGHRSLENTAMNETAHAFQACKVFVCNVILQDLDGVLPMLFSHQSPFY